MFSGTAKKKWNEFAVKLCELGLQLEGREQEGWEQPLVPLGSSSPSSTLSCPAPSPAAADRLAF